MRKLLSALPLVAVLATTAVSHAAPLTGQFSVFGDLTNTGTALNFLDANVSNNAATLSGSFSTILTPGAAVSASNPTLNYSPYTSGSEVFTVDGLTINLLTFVQNSTPGMFTGTALLSAAGYDSTNATINLTTQNSGAVTFSATTTATGTSPVPEPSTLALLGTGVLGAAGAIRRRFSM